MITALILIGGWFLICAFTVLLVRGGGSHIEIPKPVPTNDQIAWMTAAAKVAARRHA